MEKDREDPVVPPVEDLLDESADELLLRGHARSPVGGVEVDDLSNSGLPGCKFLASPAKVCPDCARSLRGRHRPSSQQRMLAQQPSEEDLTMSKTSIQRRSP